MFDASAKSTRLLLPLAVVASLALGGCWSAEERAQVHYTRGMDYLAKRDLPKAEIEFKVALQKKKDMVAAWRGLAEVEVQKKNWQSVAGIYRNITELDPRDLDTRLKFARLLISSNATDDADKVVTEAEKLEDKNSSVLAVRAALQLKLDRPDEAIKAAKASLLLDPNNAEAVVVLAAERTTAKDYQAALKLLSGEKIASAGDLGIELFRLQLFERLGEQDHIEGLLKKLASAYPSEPSFRQQLARFYVNQKRLDAAEQQFRILATARPDDTDAGLNVVRFLLAFKGKDEALQELHARISVGGNVFDYQMALADLLATSGKIDDSATLLKSLIANTSDVRQKAAAQTGLGDLYLATKKFDAANAVASDLLKADQRNGGGLRLRAAVEMEQGKLDQAIADLRQALNDQPQSSQLMVLLAIAYERSGAIELADKQFADATRASDYAPQVALDYVAFLRRRDGDARAENILNELQGRNPNNIGVLKALGSLRLARQDWIGAQEISDKLRSIGTADGSAEQILAASLEGQRKFEQSISVLQTSYDSLSGSTQQLHALIAALMRAKQADRARAIVDGILKKDPGNAEALMLLGGIQLVSNETDLAVQSFQTALKQQPKAIGAYRALTDVYVRQGKDGEAIKLLQNALVQNSDSGVLRVALAGVLEHNGDYDAAIKEYEALYRQDPASLIVANNLASLLSDHRADKESLDRALALGAALRGSPIPQFKDTLGWLQYKRGEFKDAVQLLESAVEQMPNMPLVRYHLALTYVATGQSDKAIEQLNRGLALAPANGDVRDKIELALRQSGKSGKT